ncbi:hypothetical protein BKA64DRAFT_241660 [Cadophora sp. MPI-SDFR-AT-0126]|nr:hypothetical protein BKA64DRAFT_241660 [Leotiomycetes sp. MPI-SDFR-AT-0126]
MSSPDTESAIQWVLIGIIITRVKGIRFQGHSTSTRERLQLERDANNQHDANAITVRDESGQGDGFLDSNLASILAPHLDAGAIRLCGSRWN